MHYGNDQPETSNSALLYQSLLSLKVDISVFHKLRKQNRIELLILVVEVGLDVNITTLLEVFCLYYLLHIMVTKSHKIIM